MYAYFHIKSISIRQIESIDKRTSTYESATHSSNGISQENYDFNHDNDENSPIQNHYQSYQRFQSDENCIFSNEIKSFSYGKTTPIENTLDTSILKNTEDQNILCNHNIKQKKKRRMDSVEEESTNDIKKNMKRELSSWKLFDGSHDLF